MVGLPPPPRGGSPDGQCHPRGVIVYQSGLPFAGRRRHDTQCREGSGLSGGRSGRPRDGSRRGNHEASHGARFGAPCAAGRNGGSRCGHGVGIRGEGGRRRVEWAGGTRRGGRRGGAPGTRVDRAAAGHPPAPRDAGAGTPYRRCGGPRAASGRAGRHHRGGRPRRRRRPARLASGADGRVPGGHGRGAGRGHRRGRPGAGPPLRARHPHHGVHRRRTGPGAAAAATERNGGVPLPAGRGDVVRGPRGDRRRRPGAHRRRGDPRAALRTLPRRPVRRDPGPRDAGPGQRGGDPPRAGRARCRAAPGRRDRHARHGGTPADPRGHRADRRRRPDSRRGRWPGSWPCGPEHRAPR